MNWAAPDVLSSFGLMLDVSPLVSVMRLTLMMSDITQRRRHVVVPLTHDMSVELHGIDEWSGYRTLE